jgi:hypothetical protein
MSSTTLTMIAVIMTATFMVTAFVWQQPQQTQALMRSESSSPLCVENQPCHTSVTNSSTPRSKLTSSPYSASSSKLVPSPASLFAPHSLLPPSFLPDTSSAHPSSAHPSSAHPSSAHPSSAHPSSAHPSSAHPSSPSSKLTSSPAAAAAALSLTPPPSSSKLKHHNFHSSTSTTSHASSSNSTGLSYELSHLFD